ncbi:sugar ABC transporter permease [Alicyclobacillus vulcanalis]|uniref:Xylose transport system permease protein XylH n=1 Tax=Alicyclobacillus vulcanalis TaxID=252246 RepID=A0A1N7PMI2_9BACL|nr:ABC transporter permease [Alicyclobacillus vulcanalis]SIT11798.1 D-xylose transport system permease protein [Alicyclobacillus vulcanalis]
MTVNIGEAKDLKTPAARSTSVFDRVIGGEFQQLPVFLSLILIWIVFEILNNSFLTSRNLSNLVLQMAEYGLLGIGETLILLLGEIDLSIAAVSAIGGAVLAVLAGMNVNPYVAILAGVLSGTVLGLFQGFWVTVLRVPSFIVTLAGSLGFLGLLFVLIGQEGTVPIMNNTINAIAGNYLPDWLSWVLVAVAIVAMVWATLRDRAKRQQLGLSQKSAASTWTKLVLSAVVMVGATILLNAYQGVPIAGLVLIVFVVLFAWLCQSTSFGRHIYAVGGNAEAARRAGINVKGVRVMVFTLAGTMAAIGGIVGASRLGAASTASGGSDLLMDSIAAAVIGGTSLFGGYGSVWNALLGALVIGSIENGMALLNAPTSTKYLVEGAILLLAVTFDTFTRMRRKQLGK